MKQLSEVVQAIVEHLSDANEDPTPEDESQVRRELNDMMIELSLFPETHIYELCRASGGRIKQQNIVEETGWSPSKVSRLLSEMEAEGYITRVRVGRENAVCLPEKMPGSVRKIPPDA